MQFAAHARRAVLVGALLAGCSDGGDPRIVGPLDASWEQPADARPIDAADRGTRRAYVLSLLRVPTSAAEARALGLDVDLAPDDADAGIDNQLGAMLARLRELADVTPTDATARAVDRGDILVLVDVYFDRDLVASDRATAWLGLGRDPQPPPCDGPTDNRCRHHLDGHGTLARDGAAGVPLTGTLADHRFDGAGGTLALPLVFREDEVTVLHLERAAAVFTGLGDYSLIGGKLGGAVRVDEVHDAVLPALHTTLGWSFDGDCPPPREPPTCGCIPDSGGEALRAALDVDGDCVLTEAETDAYLTRAAPPDLDLDGDGAADAYSLGVGVSGVVATFPEP
ncbi:MAG TPA: hypothetical protein VHE35_34255 [Kofleriaceae bacterium]|nr:hypothetical protein [Kofleriaceae bacterium]